MEFVKLKKKIFPMLYKENVVVQETLEKLAVLLWLNLAGLKILSNIKYPCFRGCNPEAYY